MSATIWCDDVSWSLVSWSHIPLHSRRMSQLKATVVVNVTMAIAVNVTMAISDAEEDWSFYHRSEPDSLHTTWIDAH